jgi:hypothetical protein
MTDRPSQPPPPRPQPAPKPAYEPLKTEKMSEGEKPPRR